VTVALVEEVVCRAEMSRRHGVRWGSWYPILVQNCLLCIRRYIQRQTDASGGLFERLHRPINPLIAG
jgi:hypothetical protein